jgi:acid stress chaperone HdeB
MTRLAVTAGGLALLLATGAPAQVTIDVSKITCNQWLTYKIADPDHIAIWLSGYFKGQRNDVVLEVQAFKEDIARLKDACFRSPDMPVMQALEKQMGGKK